MKAKAHVYASLAAGGAAYAATASPPVAISCLLSGIFLDVDHLLDFYLLSGERFTVKGFISWCDDVRWTRIYLFLHSYELYLLLALAARLLASEVLTGILLGAGLHLAMDQAGNVRLNKWFYFLTFRYRSGFKKALLLRER